MSQQDESPWPDKCEAAVSLTFDDGLPSQLRRAVPYLEKQGLKGTFYLNPKDGEWEERLKLWRSAAAAGHEIGNHTCSHPCSRNFWGQEKGLEGMTLEEIEADIVEAERRLNEALPGQAARSFCYPCYNNHVGAGAARQSYVPVVARHFIAGRGGSVERAFLNEPACCDLHYLGSESCERMGGYEMIGLCEVAALKGRWCILTFHGISEGSLSVHEADFRQLCDYLARRRERLYVAPLVEVAQRLRAWRGRR